MIYEVCVLVQDTAHAVNVGGAVTYRHIAFELTPAQSALIRLDPNYESIAKVSMQQVALVEEATDFKTIC